MIEYKPKNTEVKIVDKSGARPVFPISRATSCGGSPVIRISVKEESQKPSAELDRLARAALEEFATGETRKLPL